MRVTPLKEVLLLSGFAITTVVCYMLILYVAESGHAYAIREARAGAIHAVWPTASLLCLIVMVPAGMFISLGIASLLFGHPMKRIEARLDETDPLPTLNDEQNDALIKALGVLHIILNGPAGFGAIYTWGLVMDSGVWRGYVSENIAGIGYPVMIFVAIGISVMTIERLLALYYRLYVSKMTDVK